MSDPSTGGAMGEMKPVTLDYDDSGLPNPGVLSYETKEAVCGEDNRSRVSPATNFPYHWICSLRMVFDGDLFIGSGWLVDVGSNKYDVVVTSGHCVFGGGSFADSVEVIPARDANEAPWGTFTVARDGLRASQGWQDQGPDKSHFDYGAILIPKTGVLGAMQYGVLSDAELQNRVVTNSGYPGDKPSGTLWSDGGPLAEVSESMIRYMADTAGGQSGSPTYTWADDNILRTVGIHGYGGCPNGAVRVTDAVVQDLEAWGQS